MDTRAVTESYDRLTLALEHLRAAPAALDALVPSSPMDDLDDDERAVYFIARSLELFVAEARTAADGMSDACRPRPALRSVEP